MYVQPNFKTKKAMKEAVKAGQRVEVFSPSSFPYKAVAHEVLSVEGPHHPEPHRWYARVAVRYGVVVEVVG